MRGGACSAIPQLCKRLRCSPRAGLRAPSRWQHIYTPRVSQQPGRRLGRSGRPASGQRSRKVGPSRLCGAGQQSSSRPTQCRSVYSSPKATALATGRTSCLGQSTVLMAIPWHTCAACCLGPKGPEEDSIPAQQPPVCQRVCRHHPQGGYHVPRGVRHQLRVLSFAGVSGVGPLKNSNFVQPPDPPPQTPALPTRLCTHQAHEMQQ